MYTTVKLKKNQDRRIKSGYLWVFSNEIEGTDREVKPGEIVYIRNASNNFVGMGFYNPNSLISVRLLSRHEEEVGLNFFKKRFIAALKYREDVYPAERSYRLVFGESDFLPGLIIDKYENYLSIKITAKGMYQFLPLIMEALESLLKPHSVFMRIDDNISKLEKISEESKWLKGSAQKEVEIIDGPLRFLIDIENGQKTGFFFDQRENRNKLQKYVYNKNVLDCFCYTGAFSLTASFFGAREVRGIDISKSALLLAEKNAKLNNRKNCSFLKDDVMEYLKKCDKPDRKYDMIIADPPAFIKSKKSFHAGLSKYIKLNTMAMLAIKKNGYLFTSSCSHHLGDDLFSKMIAEASKKARKKVQIIEFGSQSKDHPVLPAMPETKYLSSVLCRIG